MGIFDDAIREHLELKRHAGADEEELKELEDEAFGPPARPGDPDFPSSTSEEAAVEGDAAASGGVFDAETASEGAPAAEASADAPATEASLAQADAPDADAPSPTEAVPPRAFEEAASLQEAPTEVAPATEATEPEGADPAGEVGDLSSFTTAEREAIADQPTVFFEQQAPAELELGDLELDLDEEIEEVGGSVSEPLSEEEPVASDPEPTLTESEPVEPEPEPELEPEPEPLDPEASAPAPPETTDFEEAAAEPEAAEPATGDEDVLEETPEFLRENPDDDELWFEQGEPKDFDF